jgi:ABC-type antimicrobial peptide transport system permease subunit
MTFRDKVSISFSNLGRRKVRTALTSVGVVVGILTVVTMVSLVNGVQHQVNAQFEKIGLDRVLVKPKTSDSESGLGGPFGGFDPFGTSERTQLITDAEIKRWKGWPEVKQAVPEIDIPGSVASGLTLDGKTVPVRIAGESGPRRGPFAESKDALYGTLELPDGPGSVIVSRGTLRRLKIPKEGFAKVLGRSVNIVLASPRGERQNYALKVVGITDDGSRQIQVSTPDRISMKGWWFNNKNILKTEGYDSVALRTADVSQSKIVVDRLRKEKWDVQSIDAILDVANKIFSVITVMLAMASSIALMVACIGIVNTMIMSIYERTREIGTLKAMGASRSDIRHLFMMEAGFIGLIGGSVGLICSWLLGRGLNGVAAFFARQRGLPMPENLFIITPILALQALAFALFIGVVAGLYPANRAAGLDPLKALRHE